MSSSWFVLSALYAPFYWTHLSLLPRWTNVHPKHILQISLLPPIIVFLLIVGSLDILNKSSRSLGVPSGGNHIHNRWDLSKLCFLLSTHIAGQKKTTATNCCTGYLFICFRVGPSWENYTESFTKQCCQKNNHFKAISPTFAFAMLVCQTQPSRLYKWR